MHFREPLKTQAEVARITFCKSTPPVQGPTGKHLELFEYALHACSKLPTISELRTKIKTYIQSGALIAESNILHVACTNNNYDMVRLVLDEFVVDDPRSSTASGIVNTPDSAGTTPLMLAAVNAAGWKTKDGITDTRVIDLLLLRGANKALQDRSGMTAYGHFVKQTKDYETMMQSLLGQPVIEKSRSLIEQTISAKLLPPGGPSKNDLTGGKTEGLMDYTEIDREADREMGLWGGGYDEGDY